MDTDNRSRSGSETGLLRSCTTFLLRRDFTVCRQLANRVTKSDPETVTQLEQLVAITDVLTAASSLIGPTNNLPDLYAILNLNPSDAENRDLIRQRFKKLVRLLDPNKNKFPFADEALMRVREAWTVLSDPVKRDELHNQICGGEKKCSSFWTMCPYCWYMLEYERKYEGCTFRCENCKRTFHGMEVKAPAAESMVKGKEQYYCHHVTLPLKYPLNGGKRMRIKTVAKRVRMKGFVADESDSDLEK